jgi:hypothetical protein
MRSFAIALLLMLAWGLTAAPGAASEDTFDPSLRVTFSADELAKMLRKTSKRKLREANLWSPSESDVEQFETKFAARLEEAMAGGYGYPIASYYRQYFGLVIDGKRIVIGNAFTDAFVQHSIRSGRAADFWKSELVMFEGDGGCMFFRAEFDAATKAIRRASCNAGYPIVY